MIIFMTPLNRMASVGNFTFKSQAPPSQSANPPLPSLLMLFKKWILKIIEIMIFDKL